MKNNPVGWFEIYVQDMARAKEFYAKVLQIKLEKLESPGIEMWAFPMGMEKPGSSGALVHMPGFPSGGNSTLVYFNCSDSAVEEARVESTGGKVEHSKMSIGEYGFVTLAYDPDGNMFGLHSLE